MYLWIILVKSYIFWEVRDWIEEEEANFLVKGGMCEWEKKREGDEMRRKSLVFLKSL